MRQLIEAVKGMEVDNIDGIKVFEPEGWVQVLPDPDEPVFHLYAEGASIGGISPPRGEVPCAARRVRVGHGLNLTVKPSTRA